MKRRMAICCALLAAVLFGVSSPASKLLLERLPPTLMASLLYLGSGFGILALRLLRDAKGGKRREAKLTRADLPYITAVLALDVAGPILLMFGITMTTPANASLLSNFEIAATSLFAFLVFKEAVGRRMWLAIALVTVSSAILSFEDMSVLSFSTGSVLVLASAVCWGLESNCTRMMSLKDPMQIVIIKGLGSGTGSFAIAIALGERAADAVYIVLALLLGSVAYGLSVYLYILAQRELGASRASAYASAAPFVGVGLSLVIFGQALTLSFAAALLIMVFGVYFAVTERHAHSHAHEDAEHEHRHGHSDGHHTHTHDFPVEGEHTHMHRHERMTHEHSHTPDLHHVHSH